MSLFGFFWSLACRPFSIKCRPSSYPQSGSWVPQKNYQNEWQCSRASGPATPMWAGQQRRDSDWQAISKEETPCFVCLNNMRCFSFEMCSPSMLWLVTPPWSPPQQQQLETPPTRVLHPPPGQAGLIRRMPGIPHRLYDGTLLIHDCHATKSAIKLARSDHTTDDEHLPNLWMNRSPAQ
jgi:hypothetical protein